MNNAVAHRDKDIAQTHRKARFKNSFARYDVFRLFIVEALAVAQHNHIRIVILDEPHLVFMYLNRCKRRIGNLTHRTDRKRLRNRIDAVLNSHFRIHHRRDDL